MAQGPFIEYVIYDKSSKVRLGTAMEVVTPLQIDEQIEGLTHRESIHIVKGLGRVNLPNQAHFTNAAWVLTIK